MVVTASYYFKPGWLMLLKSVMSNAETCIHDFKNFVFLNFLYVSQAANRPKKYF
jgi:hypothetical protein